MASRQFFLKRCKNIQTIILSHLIVFENLNFDKIHTNLKNFQIILLLKIHKVFNFLYLKLFKLNANY